MDIASLRTFVEREIDEYVYGAPESAIGKPMSQEWVQQQLTELRQALVTPQWVAIQLKDTLHQMESASPILRDCVLVANDRNGIQLYYDPDQNDFVLAHSGDPPETFNVRGDAVGSFMAR